MYIAQAIDVKDGENNDLKFLYGLIYKSISEPANAYLIAGRFLLKKKEFCRIISLIITSFFKLKLNRCNLFCEKQLL